MARKDTTKLYTPSCVFRKTIYNLSTRVISIDAFLSATVNLLKSLLKRYRNKYGCLKFQLALLVKFRKRDGEGEWMLCRPYFTSSMRNVTPGSSVGKILEKAFEEITCSFDAFTSQGSGWQLKKVIRLHLCIVRVKRNVVGRGKSCFHGIKNDLPSYLKCKRGILTLRNSPENQCFAYCVAAALLNIKKNSGRIRQYVDKVQTFQCVRNPMALTDIPRFELANRIGVNVFGWNTKSSRMRVLYRSRIKVQKDEICDLLFYKGHYHVVRNLNSLATGRYYKDLYLCRKCFVTFSKPIYLKRHEKHCGKAKKQRYSVPPKGKYIQFENFRHMFRNQFVYYADFETIAVKCNKRKGTKTKLTHHHVPVSFGIMRVSTNKNHSTMPYCYHGPNVMEKFFDYLCEEKAVLQMIYENSDYPLTMEDEDEMSHSESKRCFMCNITFDSKNRKVRDHNHLLKHRNYRAALCSNCNLTYASDELKNVPVICHNMSGFDGHLILSELNKLKSRLGTLKVIPRNKQRYLCFNLGIFKFIDSLQFLTASLDTLVSNLKENGLHLFEYTSKLSEKHYHFLLQKLPYPYSFCKNLGDFNYPRLPPRESFGNKLKGKFQISVTDYNLACNVYETFECKSFLDFHILYLKTDICLLADVFENYRNMCMQWYGLDPAWYLSSSHFVKDALLKTTKMRLECLHEMKMYELFERGVRGGICTVSEKYSRANNVHMGEKYIPEDPSVYLFGVDATNLYGHCMTFSLPYGQFKWVQGSQSELKDMLLQCEAEASIGYVAEVDLHYPSSLHAETDDFPLAPEKIPIKSGYLSPYSQRLRTKLKLPKQNEKMTKLAPNLFDKQNYVVHYRNLQYYIKRGMVLQQIHCVLSFRQSKWLAPYIFANMNRRKEAKTKFEQDFFKLACNSAYGKFLENQRNRMNVTLVTTQKKFDDNVCKPTLKSVKVYNKALAGLEMLRPIVVLNRPVYVGFTVLEFAKLFMFEFHELMTKKIYKREDIRLLFTDTDSFLYAIKTENLYEDLEKIKCYMDTSNYPPDHPLYDGSKKFIAGYMKDDYPPPGKIAVEFCGLKSKMYSVLDVDDVAKMRAKGVSKISMQEIRHEAYLHCLKKASTISSNIRAIRSYDHELFSVYLKKSALNSFCDKRYVLNCGIKTRAYGHFANKICP